eukprot:m.133496 g.133496  ORF g.133496 m.133496 type:complete len:999 (-) comp16888_c2_seq1:220-3216(-)
MLRRMREKRAEKRERGGEGAGASGDMAAAADQPIVVATARARVVPGPPAISDETLLEELDDQFMNPEFDDITFITDLLPDDMSSIESIDECRKRKFQELQAVSRKLSGLVLDHHKEFVQELTRVSELQEELDMTRVICKNDRRHLSRAANSQKAGLLLARRVRKRNRFVGVAKTLRAIAMLRHASEQCDQLLAENDSESAIELWQECSHTAQQYHMFNCVGDLASELVESQARIVEHLDRQLEAQTKSLDLEAYGKLYRSYQTLGMGKEALEKLSSFLLDSVTTHCREEIAVFAKPEPGFEKLSFKSLCRSVPEDQILACLSMVCKRLCDLMIVHQDIEAWHVDAVDRERSGGDGGQGSSDSGARGGASAESGSSAAHGDEDQEGGKGDEDASSAGNGAVGQGESGAVGHTADKPTLHVYRRESMSRLKSRDYTLMKLQQSRKNLWQTMQRAVSNFLAGASFSNYTFEQFVKLLRTIRHLSDIGKDFSKHDAFILEDAVKMKTLVFLTEFHRQTLHTLKGKLEMETWEASPVPPGFNIFNLPQFRFMRSKRASMSRGASTASMDGTGESGGVATPAPTLSSFRRRNSFFKQPSVDTDSSGPTSPTVDIPPSPSPMEAGVDLTRRASISEEVKTGSPTRPATGSAAPPPPHCTETTIFVVQQFGLYIDMMDTLQSVAAEVFKLMTQVFEYYLNTVFDFFGTDNNAYPITVLSQKARHAVRAIQARADPSQNMEGSQPLHATVLSFLGAARLNGDVALASPSNLFGLAARITGIESLMFLVTVWRSLTNNLKRRMPSKHHGLIERFFAESVDIVRELRWFLYKNAAAKMLNFTTITTQMSSVKWDIKDIKSQHSAYVDQLIQDCNILSGRISSLGKARVPQGAYNTLWSEVLLQVNLALLDGFALAKKCTNEGRALMQLDYQQYLSKLSKITTVRPSKDIVENYIKAFYIGEADFEEWVQANHKTYSLKQLQALVTVLPLSNKRSRKDLTRVVEEIKNPS